MYEIYYLKNVEWIYFTTVDNLKDLDKIVYRFTMLRPNKSILILQDGNELTCLDGSEYQYWYFKNRYIRNKNLEYDYVKTYSRKEDKNGN